MDTLRRLLAAFDAPKGTRTYRIARLFALAGAWPIATGAWAPLEAAGYVGAIGALLGLSKGGTALQIGAGQPPAPSLTIPTAGDTTVNTEPPPAA